MNRVTSERVAGVDVNAWTMKQKEVDSRAVGEDSQWSARNDRTRIEMELVDDEDMNGLGAVRKTE